MTLEISESTTPLGDVRAVWREGRLCSLAFSEHWNVVERALRRRFGAAERLGSTDGLDLRKRLAAYFAGDLDAFVGVEIDPRGTRVQQAVWTALRRVPAGETTTYAALARAIGAPTAVRAVGAANGANPIWLIIPCHRAIGSDGRLVGYAGGLERKRWLLAHESAAAPQTLLPLGAASAT